MDPKMILEAPRDTIITAVPLEIPKQMIHRKVKKLAIEGQFLDDSMIPKTRAQYESLLVHDARSRGYIPVLDLSTMWSTEYKSSDDTWKFALAVYVVYVGKRKAKEWEGLSGGRLLPRNTPRITSEKSSEISE